MNTEKYKKSGINFFVLSKIEITIQIGQTILRVILALSLPNLPLKTT